MKYSPKLYAQAFGELAEGARTKDAQANLVKNFLRIVEKHNDAGRLEKIFDACERYLRAKEGLRKVAIGTARPLASAKKSLKGFLMPDDIVEERIDPELVAGMKITVDDEMQFDASMKRKLEKLFNI